MSLTATRFLIRVTRVLTSVGTSTLELFIKIHKTVFYSTEKLKNKNVNHKRLFDDYKVKPRKEIVKTPHNHSKDRHLSHRQTQSRSTSLSNTVGVWRRTPEGDATTVPRINMWSICQEGRLTLQEIITYRLEVRRQNGNFGPSTHNSMSETLSWIKTKRVLLLPGLGPSGTHDPRVQSGTHVDP